MKVVVSKNGIRIRLTSERWEHITTGHPEMADYYYEILETVETPDKIYKGNNDAKIAVKSYSNFFGKFLVVIYKETSSFDGFILTAYLTNKPVKFHGKNLLWKQVN
jgi:hypothetical protein